MATLSRRCIFTTLTSLSIFVVHVFNVWILLQPIAGELASCRTSRRFENR